MAQLLLGKPAADALDIQTRAMVETLSVIPRLVCVRVGEDPSALSYERACMKRAEALGCEVEVVHISLEDATTSKLIATIHDINERDDVHGCLLFRPLPKTVDEHAVCEALCVTKDVDGITCASLAGVFTGSNQGFAPCTAESVLRLLEFYEVPIEGARVCVLGRSLVIGRPVSMLLLHKNASVSMCHSRTQDIATYTRNADIIVCAVGHAGYLTKDMVSSEQTIIDVGINWDPAINKIVGDVAFDEVDPLISRITPVPRGVGSMTTSLLFSHVAQAAARNE